MKYFALLLALLSGVVFGQATCSVTGPDGYNGPAAPSINFQCGGSPPPPPPPPPAQCDASQLSSPIGGKTLHRQCSALMIVLPVGISYSGAADNFGTVFGGSTWPNYNYAGYSPTFSILTGYYISMAFTPTSAGAFQVTANPSYGNGGTVAISTVPGAMTQGSAGFVCGVGRSAANGIYVSTSGGVCGVTVGTNYYLNIADVDSAGNNLCYNGRPNSCASSTVSYTIYTSGQ